MARAPHPGPGGRTRRGTSAGTPAAPGSGPGTAAAPRGRTRRPGRAARRSARASRPWSRGMCDDQVDVRLAGLARAASICSTPMPVAQLPVERAEEVGEALGQGVVGLVRERQQPHLAAQLAEVLLEADEERQRARPRTWTRTRLVRSAPRGAGSWSKPVIDAGERPSPSRTPRPGANQTTLPSSSISAPQASAQRATMLRPRPKVSSRSSVSGRSRARSGRIGASTRAVAHLDARVLGGAAHPHRDRRLAVQQGVGDQLGDAQLGALRQLVAGRSPCTGSPPSGVRPARRGDLRPGSGRGRLSGTGWLQRGSRQWSGSVERLSTRSGGRPNLRAGRPHSLWRPYLTISVVSRTARMSIASSTRGAARGDPAPRAPSRGRSSAHRKGTER